MVGHENCGPFLGSQVNMASNVPVSTTTRIATTPPYQLKVQTLALTMEPAFKKDTVQSAFCHAHGWL